MASHSCATAIFAVDRPNSSVAEGLALVIVLVEDGIRVFELVLDFSFGAIEEKKDENESSEGFESEKVFETLWQGVFIRL